MQQKPPQFGSAIMAERLQDALNVPADAVDMRYPIQVVSTGVPFLMIPLKTRAAVEAARVNKADLGAVLADAGAADHGALLFCPEPVSAENTLHARVLFAGILEVDEDSATGAANGCLAGYLSRYQYFGSSVVDARVEQGYMMKRPSLLRLKAAEVGDHIEVRVGGSVVLVARGTLV
jgi:trans-2,3-dihydro-3-hydroxyanthranilate isomerase